MCRSEAKLQTVSLCRPRPRQAPPRLAPPTCGHALARPRQATPTASLSFLATPLDGHAHTSPTKPAPPSPGPTHPRPCSLGLGSRSRASMSPPGLPGCTLRPLGTTVTGTAVCRPQRVRNPKRTRFNRSSEVFPPATPRDAGPTRRDSGGLGLPGQPAKLFYLNANFDFFLGS